MRVEGATSQLDLLVSHAIVRSWLWLTATRNSPFGCFSTLLKVVDNLPHILWQQILHWEAPGHRRKTLLLQHSLFFSQLKPPCFVDGGSNVAIVNALPLIFFCIALCLNIQSCIASINLFFMLAWNFGFWRLTWAPGILFLVSAESSAVNEWCLSKNLSGLTVAFFQYNLLLCSETLVLDRNHLSKLLVPEFGCSVSLCWDRMPRDCGMAAYVQDRYGAFCQPKWVWLFQNTVYCHPESMGLAGDELCLTVRQLPMFNFIPHRSHHMLILLRS